MIRRPVFDAIRRLLGRGLRQREVAAIDAALDAAAQGDDFLSLDRVTPVPCPTSATRRVSAEGVALIKRFEGCARRRADGDFEAYPDPGAGAAPWTIGWGATGPGIGPGTRWTQAQCDARLVADVARHADDVSKALGEAPTTQAQFDALVSFHYNTGAIGRATLTRKHIAGDYAGAAAEFARWNRAGGRVLKGLVRRRTAEAQLYLNRRPSERNPAGRTALAGEAGVQHMLRLMAPAAMVILAAAGPALAQGKGHGGGNGHGSERAQKAHGSSRMASDDHGRQAAAKSSKAEKASARATGAGRAEHAKQAAGVVRDRRDGDRGQDTRNADWNRHGDWEGRGDRDGRDAVFALVPGCPPGLAKKHNGCLPPGQARQNRDRYFGYEYRPALFAVPLHTRADYAYYDGFLVPPSGSGLSYIPLLGGALAVGRLWPETYPSLALAGWQQDYYGFDDQRTYRYADNVVYQVDPQSAAIEAVVALLTGSDFAVGEPMPAGYDVYTVPGPYRDRYADTDDALYRYADGRIYEIDPTSMLIAKAIDLVL